MKPNHLTALNKIQNLCHAFN